MATVTKCDFCDRSVEEYFQVAILDTSTDDEVLEKDACTSCFDLIRRLLGKTSEQLEKAIEAVSVR